MEIFTSASYIAKALVTVRSTNRDQCPPLVPVGSTNRDQRPPLKRGIWSRLVAPTGTKGCVLELAQCGGMFSPTSLAERGLEWFISFAEPTTSSSSLLQAYGPKIILCACGPIGPTTGLHPGPSNEFLVVCRPW